MVVPKEGAGQEGLGTSSQALSVLFYADDRLVTSPKSACLQEAFDTLTNFFDQVGLCTNKGNTVSMACQPCHTSHAC